jgi:hypothetical protein
VRHLQFKEKYKDYLSILKYLEENGYIINLSVEGDNISFTFSTYQVKDLLTSAGKILEVYTYHKARETGQFDDIVNGYELKWYNTEVKNEFDCILTRGFNTLFVECKARKEISQDFYFKISGLAKKFGINAHIVLVADTQDGEHCSLPNELQMKRGSMLDVITVWKRDEINNIGYTLLSIINGKYSEEDIYE